MATQDRIPAPDHSLVADRAPTRAPVPARVLGLVRSADVWGCALLAVAFLVTFRVSPWSQDVANDFGVFIPDAGAFVHGLLPYRDVFFEYPPLAAPILAVPHALGGGGWGYIHAFALEMFLFGSAVLLLMRRIAVLTRGSGALAAVAVGISPLLIGAVTRSRFDLAPVAFAVAALFLLLKNRPKLGLAALGIAVVIKGFPIAAVPAALAWVWACRGRRAALWSTAAFAATVAVVMGAAFAISPHGIVHAISFQINDPIQLESTPASILFALSHLGLSGAPVGVYSQRKFALVAPGSHVIAVLVLAVGILTIATLAVGAFRRPGRRELVLAVSASLAAYAAFTSVYSPQYVIWALPLFVAAVSWRHRGIALTMGVAMVLTLEEYSHFQLVVAHSGAWIAVVAVRNLLTCVAVWLAGASVLGAPESLRALVPARLSLSRPD